MQSQAFVAAPVFELKGRASFIDLSAWISGLSYAAGLALIGSPRLESEIVNGGFGVYVLPLAYLAFFASVLLIQRHMRLSLLANTFGAPKHLVTGGVFQYSRNPIYVGFFLPLASFAVISLSTAIAAIGIYVLAMNLTVIRKEERDLLNAFGSEFAEYLGQAPRWLF
jgi:protein-S-isoprenylcysteine O-methyltransferase Ste14